MYCVIHQPTYFPWIGFFDLLDQAAVYVVLDSVAFSRQSWQQRNRVKTANGLEWLVVPVKKKGLLGAAISDIALVDDRFATKHLKTIKQNYQSAPYYATVYPLLQEGLETGSALGTLCGLNVTLIALIADYLGISVKIMRATSLPVQGKRSELLVSILDHLQCDTYLSTKGAEAYLKEDAGIFQAHGVRIFLHEYVHPEYPQMHPPFAPYASIIDLLFNAGPESLSVIRSGRRPATALDAAP